MLLARVIGDFFRNRGVAAPDAPRALEVPTDRPALLNVGGNNKNIPIPSHYDGWHHLLLDIDPAGSPDIVADARELVALPPSQFDAIYCSHNLEHYYRHDAVRVLQGFRHLLKPRGFAEIAVPDLASVMRMVVGTGLDIDDILYESPMGPIAVRDVIYGLGRQIEASGVDFYAHKNGFSPISLKAFLESAGFAPVIVREYPAAYEIRAFAFTGEPTLDQRQRLDLLR